MAAKLPLLESIRSDPTEEDNTLTSNGKQINTKKIFYYLLSIRMDRMLIFSRFSVRFLYALMTIVK